MSTLRTYQYDGSWVGLVCALYHAYRQLQHEPEQPRPRILARPEPAAGGGGGLFEEMVPVATDPELAERVLGAVRRHGTSRLPGRMYRAFLSEARAVESLLLAYLQAVRAYGAAVEYDVLIEPAREVERLARAVNREVHRMHAFVRFEAHATDARADGARLWRACIEPACNVLPLLGDHFTTRYPAQPWLILDVGRSLMLYWDTETLRLLAAPTDPVGGAPRAVPEEALFQKLWQAYFAAVDIPARRNPGLQQRHLPKRYRKHLTELRPRL